MGTKEDDYMGVVDGAKKFVSGFQKTIKKISGAIKFFSTYLGWVVGALILIIFLVIAITVLVNTIGHALAEFLGDDVGISTDADYEYMVSSLGYAGYDSLISEKNFQEYMAYEYAVLMDVAEYLYKGQNDYEEAGGDAAAAAGTQPKGPKTMPYLEVKTDFDFAYLDDATWRSMIVEGQGAERPVTFSDLGDAAGHERILVGGSPYVSRPVISYEYKLNSFESTEGSLVPYITVVRDDLKYHYYSTGDWEFSGGDAIITADNVQNVNLIKIHYGLNANNGALPKSFDYVRRETKENGNSEGLITSNPDNWPKAEDNFGGELYFNDTYDSVTYKMSLQLLIDRYLPKANLLTSWFLLKDNDSASGETTGKKPATGFEGKADQFNIDMLMKDIKGIYNYYCWGPGEVDGIASSSAESLTTETVSTVKYDETTGVVERYTSGEHSGEAIMVSGEKWYSTTNNKTFMSFVQVGLETNRYEVYKEYKPTEASASKMTTMPKAPKEVTGDESETTLPIVTDLLSDSAYFLDKMDLKVNFAYKYDYIIYNKSGEVLNADAPEGQWKNQIDTFSDDAKDYISGDVLGTGTFSDTIMNQIIKPVENDMNIQKVDRGVTQDFVNYEYVFPTRTAERDGSVTAEVPFSFYDSSYKDNKIAFYNFSVYNKTPAQIMDDFKTRVNNKLSGAGLTQSQLGVSSRVPKPAGYTNYSGEYEYGVTTDYNIIVDKTPTFNNSYPEMSYVARVIKDVYVTSVVCDSVDFSNLKDDCQDGLHNPKRAVFDVTETKIGMSLTILQKRMSAVLVKSAETWSKTANYTHNINQESFDPFNEKYVIPHNGRNFGILVFNIVENPTYRTEYYKDYFSKVKNAEPGIKEADVLSMLMNWEEYGAKGIDSAYNFMRDLYKLILYTREKGKDFDENERPNFWNEDGTINLNFLSWRNPYILKNAYTYLYVPETIWSFREGKTQEVFWIERLTAKEYGNPDAMTQEEQEKVVTKNNEISWQLLDYEDYEECAVGTDDTQVYALFPYGNELVRTYFMEEAMKSGTFYDGGNTSGHQAVDWHSRGKLMDILHQTSQLGKDIYEYELARRTLINIMNGVGNAEEKYNNAKNFMADYNNRATIQAQYNKAKRELEEYLYNEYIESPIIAIAPGEVTTANYSARGGFQVSIKHTKDGSVTSSYCHFRRWPLVNEGDIVGAGTVIGYEGDTGNSTGSHLHMSVKTGDAQGRDSSPSTYLAPIYTPFYNIDKITEFLAEYEDYNKDKLILSTDYMSLTRTVLMARFDSNGSVTQIKQPDASLLESVSLIYIPSDDPTESGEYMYVKDDGGMAYMMYNDPATGINSCVIKVGVQPNEKFYKCTFEIKEKTKIKNGKLVWDAFDDGRTFKILTREPVNEDSIYLQGIQVQIKCDGTKATANVNWGNTTPYLPLITNDRFDKLITKGAFDGEDEFDTSNWRSVTDNSGDGNTFRTTLTDGLWNTKEKDVRAWSKLFDSSSNEVRERLKNKSASPDAYLHMADSEVAYTVPFYEGPFSKEYSEQTLEPGAYGALSGDLASLQSALKARGFDNPDTPMNTDGIYDDITVEVFKAAGQKLADSTDLDSLLGPMKNDGAVGSQLSETLDDGGKYPYAIRPIVAWNTYLAYGSLANAQNTAIEAIKNAAVHYPSVNYFTFDAVSSCESGKIPSIESDHLYAEDKVIDLNFSNAVGDDEKYVFEFKGTKRIIRRAQGLFQILPIYAGGYLYPGASDDVVLTALRSPYSNALIGGAMLDSARIAMITDPAKMARLNSIASLPAWQNLGRDAGKDPMELLLNGMMALSLNVGQGGAWEEHRISKFEGMTYTMTGSIPNATFTIYGCPNYTGRIIGSICNGALDMNSPKAADSDL